MITVNTEKFQSEKNIKNLVADVAEIKSMLKAEIEKKPGRKIRLISGDDARNMFPGIELDIEFDSCHDRQSDSNDDAWEFHKLPKAKDCEITDFEPEPDSPTRRTMEGQLVKIANRLNILGLINAVGYMQRLENDPQCVIK